MTKMYVPAMYFRNIVCSHAIGLDHWLSLAKEKPAGLTSIEMVVDQTLFKEYTTRMEELSKACTVEGIHVPIVRVSAIDLFLDSAEKTWADVTALLKSVEAFFGPDTFVQLEMMSAQQVYETRNNTNINPDSVPAGYRYTKYANVVFNVLNKFCGVCQELGLTPVVEPRVGQVISSPDSVMRIWDKHGALPFKLVFDVSHMEFQGINTFDAWDTLKEYTVAVHISDSDIQEAHHSRVGSGKVPWNTILSYAAKSNEVGLLGVEMFSQEQEESKIKAEYAADTKLVRNMIDRFKLSSYFE